MHEIKWEGGGGGGLVYMHRYFLEEYVNYWVGCLPFLSNHLVEITV